MDLILLNIREANLLRKRLDHLLELREDLMTRPGEETVHDIRVASRRAREVLDYLEGVLPGPSFKKMQRSAKSITSKLGELRETEVNLKLSEELQKKKLISDVVSELLMHSLIQRKKKLQQRINKHFKLRNFLPYRKFLAHLKGSRTVNPASPDVLQRRIKEFYDFKVSDGMNDEKLHELRILTKKFRYAVEIYDRLQHQKLGRFLLQLKRLQEVLGDIHDLFVFGTLITHESRNWYVPGLRTIPEALDQAIHSVTLRKENLYPRAQLLHQQVLDSTPEAITRMRKEPQVAQTAQSGNSETSIGDVELIS